MRNKMAAERSSTVQNSQYHTQLNNCSIIMINKNYNAGPSQQYEGGRGGNNKAAAKPGTSRR